MAHAGAPYPGPGFIFAGGSESRISKWSARGEARPLASCALRRFQLIVAFA